MILNQTFIHTPIGLINPKFNQLLINGQVTLSLRGAPNGVFTHDVEGNFSEIINFKAAREIDEIGIVNLLPSDSQDYAIREHLSQFTVAGSKTIPELMKKVTLKQLANGIVIKLTADYFLVNPSFFSGDTFLNSGQQLPTYQPLTTSSTLYTDNHDRHYVIPLPTRVNRIHLVGTSQPVTYFDATTVSTTDMLLILDDTAKQFRIERPSSNLRQQYASQKNHSDGIIVKTLNGFELLPPSFFIQDIIVNELADQWLHAVERNDKAEW